MWYKSKKISDEFWIEYKNQFRKDLESLKKTMEKYNKLVESKNKDAATKTD